MPTERRRKPVLVEQVSLSSDGEDGTVGPRQKRKRRTRRRGRAVRPDTVDEDHSQREDKPALVDLSSSDGAKPKLVASMNETSTEEENKRKKHMVRRKPRDRSEPFSTSTPAPEYRKQEEPLIRSGDQSLKEQSQQHASMDAALGRANSANNSIQTATDQDTVMDSGEESDQEDYNADDEEEVVSPEALATHSNAGVRDSNRSTGHEQQSDRSKLHQAPGEPTGMDGQEHNRPGLTDSQLLLTEDEAIQDELLYEALFRPDDSDSEVEDHNAAKTMEPHGLSKPTLFGDKGANSSSETEEMESRNLFRPRDRPPSIPPSSSGNSSGPDLSSDSSSDESPSTVNYQRPRAACSKHDFANIAHHDTRMRSKITRQGDAAIRLYSRAMAKRREKLQAIQTKMALKRGLEAGMDENVLREVLAIASKHNEDLFVKEVRSCRKLVARITGIKCVLIDRCINNCRAFVMNEAKKGLPVVLECDYCGQSRYKAVRNQDGNLVPVATFPYIPLEHRLRLWFSEPSFVQLMTQYRRMVEKEAESSKYMDFFSGSLYMEDLKPAGFFDDEFQRDLALLVSLDEFTPFKKRPWFKVTPILVTCYNVPPEIRFKNRFLLCVGFIPGQTEQGLQAKPLNRQSFLRPFVDECKKLGSSIRVWDSLDNNYFKLRAHLCIVATDMAERFGLLGTLGYNAKLFCEFCMQIGLSSGTHIYGPHLSPVDTPQLIIAKEARKAANNEAFFDFSEEADHRRMEGVAPRTAEHFAAVLEHLRDHGQDMHVIKKWGINKPSIFDEITTIILPKSFPPDLLHLLKNVAAALLDHYDGSFFRGKHSYEHPIRDPPAGQPQGPLQGQPPNNEPVEEDPYNISGELWAEIGEFQDKSRKTIPISIGEVPNIKYSSSMKADAWFCWIVQQSPIFFSRHLPNEHFEGYMKFVRAAEMCAYGRIHTAGDIQQIEQLLQEFRVYYEEKIYQRKWRRLSACRAVIHQLGHIALTIRRLGPMSGYTQFPIERFIGGLESEIRNKSDTNGHLTHLLTTQQQMNNLPFVLPLTNELRHSFFDKIAGTESFYDGSGNLRVTKLFALAVELDVEAQETLLDTTDSDSDASERPYDRAPWYRRYNELQACFQGHRLLIANAYEDSDEDENGADGHLAAFVSKNEMVIDINMVLGRPVKKDYELKQSHQTLIIKALLDWEWLPDHVVNLPTMKEQKKVLLKNMDIRRWKALFVGKKRHELTNPMAFTMFEITDTEREPCHNNCVVSGSENPHWFRKHSAAHIHYMYDNRVGPASNRFGKVLYFLSLRKPVLPTGGVNLGERESSARSSMVSVDGDDDNSLIQIAVVEKLKIERDMCFLKSPKNSRSVLEVVDPRWIREPIGLLNWRDGNFVMWHNGSYFGWPP